MTSAGCTLATAPMKFERLCVLRRQNEVTSFKTLILVSHTNCRLTHRQVATIGLRFLYAIGHTHLTHGRNESTAGARTVHCKGTKYVPATKRCGCKDQSDAVKTSNNDDQATNCRGVRIASSPGFPSLVPRLHSPAFYRMVR